MSWATEAFNALKKIILLEERVGQLADRVDALSGLMAGVDRRVIRIETKLDVYESLSKPRKSPKQLPE